MSHGLTQDVKVTQGSTVTAGAAGAAAINGGIIDMQGFDGVLAIVSAGTIAAGGVQSLKWQQDTDSAFGGDPQDLLGTGITVADDEDDTTFVTNLHKPLERYVRLVISRATFNSTWGGIIYIQYGPRGLKTTHDATTVTASEEHVSPAEGTA